MTYVKVGGRFQVVVPKEAREALKLSPGDRLEVEVQGGTLVMRRSASLTERIFGRDSDVWSDVEPVDYVRQERATWRD